MSSISKSSDINNNEEEIILSLMKDIFQYEKKIQEINNILNNNNTNINQDYERLSQLKHQKLKLTQKISEIDQNFSEIIKDKDTQIKLKESMKNEIENKIQEYKYKLNTLNSLTFNPIITKKIFPNNNNKQNEILTNEQINDILLNSKNIKNIPEDIINDNIINEMIQVDKTEEKNLIENINNLKIKLSQTDELLKMLKEEKLSSTNELINIISCKESIDALIKFNHYLIKNYSKENTDNNKNNENNNTINDKNNDEEIYKKNKWVEPVPLLFYEICSLDSEQFSVGFNDIIIDIYDINSLPIYNKAKTNLELPGQAEKKKTNNIISNGFSISKTIKKEFEFFVKINKDNALINNENILKNFLEKISNIIINKLKLILSKKYKNDKFNEINKNIIIYLSYYVKSLYYDKIINSNQKFINKEYKYNKKELQNISNELNEEIKKYELRQKDLHHQINNKEKEIKILQNESFKKKLIDNLKTDNGNNNLTKNEQEYLQLCSNINNLISQKNEVNSICEKINIEFNNKKEEIENEKNKINTEIYNINEEIKFLEEELEQKKIKTNNEIIEYRKIIADKYNKIKSQLQISKQKYGDNGEQYNMLINNINDKIKNNENLNIEDLDMIKLKTNNLNLNENFFRNSIKSYEDDEKNNFKKNKNQYLKLNSNSSNTTEEKFYNLEFSTNRFNNNTNRDRDSFRGSNPINLNKLRGNKDKKYINLYSSNKLQKHINYIDKYFSTNSNKDNKSINNNEQTTKPKLNLKSSTQLIFYPGFRSMNSSSSGTTNKNNNNNNNNMYNTGLSCQNNTTRITSLLDKYSKNIPYYDISSINRNQISSFNTNKTLRSFKNEKLANNKEIVFDNNDNKNNGNNNEEELSRTISELKNNIIKNEKLSFSLLDKIKILTKITFCFSRKVGGGDNYIKYNPLDKISNENLCNTPYNFIKSSISLNKSYKSIRISLTAQLDPIDIIIRDIKYTIVSSSMRRMIEIYRDYKKYIKNANENNLDKDAFYKKEMEKYTNINNDYIKKCINNKKFKFILFVDETQQMEFLFFSYEDFKTWINGLAFIIKNKKKLLEYVGEI